MNTGYVYSLVNPIDNSVFYIGISRSSLRSRLIDHYAQRKKTFKPGSHLQKRYNIFKDAEKAGLKVRMALLEECDEKILRQRERYYFDAFKSYGATLFQNERYVLKAPPAPSSNQ